MGACSISVSARGKNMRDAFNNAVQDANEEYGHQEGYSGAINNCELVGDVGKERHRFQEDDHFEEWILENKASKREVYGYCTQNPVTNNNKIKTVVHNIPQKGTRKWETRYVAQARYGDSNPCINEKTQTEAIKKARAFVEKNPSAAVKVVITKILVKGGSVCASIDYKKATGERDGCYTFVGYAPE